MKKILSLVAFCVSFSINATIHDYDEKLDKENVLEILEQNKKLLNITRTEEEALESFVEGQKSGSCYFKVFRINHKTIGFTLFSSKEIAPIGGGYRFGKIYYLAFSSEKDENGIFLYRRKGYAKKLMTYAIEKLFDDGIEKITISVLLFNTPMVSLCRKLGFYNSYQSTFLLTKDNWEEVKSINKDYDSDDFRNQTIKQNNAPMIPV